MLWDRLVGQVSNAQSEVDAESSSRAVQRSSALQHELAKVQTSLRACEAERDTLREALTAFDAREAARTRSVDDDLRPYVRQEGDFKLSRAPITLSFRTFSLAAPHEVLDVYDGAHKGARLLGRFDNDSR